MQSRKQLKILGLITARGGSKRVLGKNIKDFLGKPLLGWTADVGKEAGVFDRFVLTTDDEEISEVGRKFGVEVPFMRPAELAEDTTGSYDTIKHAVEWLRDNEDYNPDWIILLEPSAPGRFAFHVKEVAGLLNNNPQFDSLMGVTETPGHFSYLKQQKRDESGVITRVTDGAIVRNLIHRNQDVPTSYYINSTIYAFKTSNLFDGNDSLWGDSTYGYVMDEKYAIDIDTPIEWLIAEVKMKALLK